MRIEIEYLKKSQKFFAKNSHLLSKSNSSQLIVKAIKKILLHEDINVDIKKLQGNLSNYYRIRQGKIRILFELDNDKIIVKAIVNDIDFRGDVY
jgi:mRNA interferase RelE/StbE